MSNCVINAQIGENCTRQSDFELTGNGSKKFQIDAIKNRKVKHIQLNIGISKSSDWTCLGAGRNVKYDCMPIEEALDEVEVMGFLAMPAKSCPLLPAEKGGLCDLDKINKSIGSYFNTGTLKLRNLKIHRN